MGKKKTLKRRGQSLVEYLILAAVVCLGIGVIRIKLDAAFTAYFDNVSDKLINAN